MKTYEELYVEIAGRLLKVDINNPSGITLKFNSNLFSDLSKITCSNSFTFSIPKTMNNRRIFDFAEDIRHHSSMIRKKIKAVFYQNGVELFSNANLYLDSASDSYKAILTWNVIVGMQELIDHDISLNEIPGYDIEVQFGRTDEGSELELFDNNSDVLYPMYNAGVPYFLWKGNLLGTTGNRQSVQWYTEYGSFPIPVVPVYHIVQMINKHFGTKFNLGQHLGIGSALKFNPLNEVCEKGVIPLCGTELTYEQRLKRKVTCKGIKYTYLNKSINAGEESLHIYDLITFDSINIPNNDFLFSSSFKAASPSEAGTTYPLAGIKSHYDNVSIEVNGCLNAVFQELGEDTPTLRIMQIQKYYAIRNIGGISTRYYSYKWVEIASIEGEANGAALGGGINYNFNFSTLFGGTREKLSNVVYSDATSNNGLGYSPMIFVFSHRLASLWSLQESIDFYINNSDSVTMGHNIDLISNLPSISCLTFMKSLFYMMGAYPNIDPNGNISANFFSELKENLSKGKVLDWSSKRVQSINGADVEIKYSNSSYAQKNYYMMKSDDVESKTDPEDIQENVYDSGIGCLEVENSILATSQTVIQIPFYPPYIRNNKFPSMETGNTIKLWDLEKNEDEKYKERYLKTLTNPQPALGIIKDREYGYENGTGSYVQEGERMTMEIWNGFKNINQNPSLSYLQEIIRKPFIITDILLLDQNDLTNLDYTVPVYINKYNSYFAIISIIRNSDGVCKCELIKLP